MIVDAYGDTVSVISILLDILKSSLWPFDDGIPRKFLDLIIYFSESYNNNSNLSIHAVHTMATDTNSIMGFIEDYFGVLGNFNAQDVAELKGVPLVCSPVSCEPSRIYLIAAVIGGEKVPFTPSRKIKSTLFAIPEAESVQLLDTLKHDQWQHTEFQGRRIIWFHGKMTRRYIESYCHQDVALRNLPDALLYAGKTVHEIDTYIERRTNLIRELGADESLVWSLLRSFMIEPGENLAMLNARAEEEELETDERKYEQWIKHQPSRTPPGEPSESTTLMNEEQIRSVCLQSWRLLSYPLPPFE